MLGGSYKSVEQPPKDFNDWYNLIHAMATHMVERHGLAEVSTWHWEVWNEMWGMDYPAHYLPLYNASARALKDVHPSLKVGGPSTMQTQHVQDLIADTRRLGLPIDFVSTHFYPSDPNCTSANASESPLAMDPDCFAKVLLKARSFANEAGLPFLITEYKDGLQVGPGNATVHSGHHGDQSYAAAFVMRNIPLLTSLDMLSYWTFTDVFEEGWGMPGAPFHGQFGCITKEGVRKPVWRAFQALHQAGDTILDVSVSDTSEAATISAFATTQSDGSDLSVRGLQVFVTNFWPMEGATANPKIPETTSITLTIAARAGMKVPDTAFLWRIDDNSTRAFAAWQDMGEPTYPTKAQLSQLNAASEMKQRN